MKPGIKPVALLATGFALLSLGQTSVPTVPLKPLLATWGEFKGWLGDGKSFVVSELGGGRVKIVRFDGKQYAQESTSWNSTLSFGRPFAPDRTPILSFATSQDLVVVPAKSPLCGVEETYKAEIRKLVSRELVRTFGSPFLCSTARRWQISHTAKYAAISYSLGYVQIWDLGTGLRRSTLLLEDRPVAVGFSPDDQLLAVCQAKGGLSIFGVADNRLLSKAQGCSNVKPLFVNGAREIIIADPSGEVVGLEVASGKRFKLTRGGGEVKSIGSSSTGNIFVLYTTGTITEYDKTAAKALRTYAVKASKGFWLSPSQPLMATNQLRAGDPDMLLELWQLPQ